MKASEMKYHNILLSSEKTIENMVFWEEENVSMPCNIGIVFGGLSMIPNRVGEAEKLYKKGYIEKILVTGGIGHLSLDRSTPEAFKMRNYLLDLGIPKQDILLEPRSRNTYENIKYSLELIKERYAFSDTKIALITSDFHMKRCRGIMENALGTKEFFSQSAKNGKTDRENWQNTMLGKRMIYQEALLLCYYAKHNRMVDFNVDSNEKARKRNKF